MAHEHALQHLAEMYLCPRSLYCQGLFPNNAMGDCCGASQVNDDCSFSLTPAGYATADGGDVACGSDPITGTADVRVDEEGTLTSFSECLGTFAVSAAGGEGPACSWILHRISSAWC